MKIKPGDVLVSRLNESVKCKVLKCFPLRSKILLRISNGEATKLSIKTVEMYFKLDKARRHPLTSIFK